MDRAQAATWVDRYERAWRAPGTDHLDRLFSPDVHYSPSPWSPAVEGLAALSRFWESERDSPDEQFTMVHDVVAVDGSTAVVRVAVDYGRGSGRWRDLWVVEIGSDGRCRRFEEWPFAPSDDDGHPPG